MEQPKLRIVESDSSEPLASKKDSNAKPNQVGMVDCCLTIKLHINCEISDVILQFQVGTVVLYGIPIVSLVIESQERLCLAQISNTLLKQFSYNEIHNRRVALGK